MLHDELSCHTGLSSKLEGFSRQNSVDCLFRFSDFSFTLFLRFKRWLFNPRIGLVLTVSRLRHTLQVLVRLLVDPHLLPDIWNLSMTVFLISKLDRFAFMSRILQNRIVYKYWFQFVSFKPYLSERFHHRSAWYSYCCFHLWFSKHSLCWEALTIGYCPFLGKQLKCLWVVLWTYQIWIQLFKGCTYIYSKIIWLCDWKRYSLIIETFYGHKFKKLPKCTYDLSFDESWVLSQKHFKLFDWHGSYGWDEQRLVELLVFLSF